MLGNTEADGAGVLSNTMQILYETVIYKSGIVNKNNVPGFATIHYDKEPSPLTVLGRGTQSIFGPGGVVDGIGSVIRNVQSGNVLGAILAASNTYNNAKKIKKGGVKEELKGIAKKGVLEVGKQAGTVTNPIGNFTVGTVVAAGAVAAVAKGAIDKKNKNDVTVISNNNIDTTQYLTAEESFNLISNNETLKDEIAAGIYYKDIGSRNGQSISESNVAYTGASATVKTVYRNKAVTDVRKLVTEGYLKIDRDSQSVSVVTEKGNL